MRPLQGACPLEPRLSCASLAADMLIKIALKHRSVMAGGRQQLVYAGPSQRHNAIGICCSDAQSRAHAAWAVSAAAICAQACPELQQTAGVPQKAAAVHLCSLQHRTRKLLELSSMLSWVPMRVNILSTSLIDAY